jgi:hypothetical protein
LTLANAFAFRALLEDLHFRDFTVVQEPHVTAIQLVRAGIMRAAISTIMAAVDRQSAHRASIGQIIHMFERVDLSVLADLWPSPALGPTELQHAKDAWIALQASDNFKDCKDFRDRVVAHTLVLAAPIVRNEAYFGVLDTAEAITRRFYRIWVYGRPSFPDHKPTLTSSAKVFWDTYFVGMANSPS